MQLGNGLFEKKVSSQRTKGRGKRPIVPCALFLSREPPTGSTKRLPRRREVWYSFSWKEKHITNSNTSGS